jgi:hypothetical protein
VKRGLLLASALACATAAAAAPVKFEKKSNTLDFTYEWSAEAAAIPALSHRFHGQLLRALGNERANVRESQQAARRYNGPFFPHSYSMTWTTAGETPRLLSLQSELSTFEGGAHPNTTCGALLWDRRRGTEVTVASLFSRASDFEALTRTAYCRALNAERSKRRQGRKMGDEFDRCPKYDALAIAPMEKGRNRRFDHIAFMAAPYVAGPYVEGQYEISLPVTAKLVAALRPEFRYSFQARPQ